MRTTVDLPEDLHNLAREVAHQQRKTMSQVIAELVRLGLKPGNREPEAATNLGLPTISVGRAITAEDVRSLEDYIGTSPLIPHHYDSPPPCWAGGDLNDD